MFVKCFGGYPEGNELIDVVKNYCVKIHTMNGKDIIIGTLRNIYRQAGWDWKE